MLNYKRFFRKRTTRIYLIVLSIIFSLIFILSFFTNYFDNKLKDTYKNNYSLLIVSSNDYYKEIRNNKSVDEIEEILLELTKIQKDYTDNEVASILENVKKELNCLV